MDRTLLCRMESGGALIAHVLEDRGHLRSRPVSLGAHKLAEWLVMNRDLFSGQYLLSRIAEVDRILCGEVIPADDVRAFIASCTLGIVLPEMFEQLGPELPEMEPGRSVSAALPSRQRAAVAKKQAVECSAEVFAGTLGGPLPSGRLFNAFADDRMPGDFVLAGMGFAIRLDLPTARAMREALDMGIAHVRDAHAMRSAAA